VVDCLPSKREALYSNPGTTKKNYKLDILVHVCNPSGSEAEGLLEPRSSSKPGQHSETLSPKQIM
jgi:hypothetical protein